MLQAYDVKHIFGLCGDTSLPFYDALCRLDRGIRHVLTRDERSAGYMADAYARVTGKVRGLRRPQRRRRRTLSAAGPGGSQPSPRFRCWALPPTWRFGSRTGRYPLTELDQEALYRPLTKWNLTIDRSGPDSGHGSRRAFAP